MDNDELRLEILHNFKTLNSITDSSKDNLYMLYIDKAIQSILNLTNRYEFPEELKYVVLEMVNDFYTNKSLQDSLTDDSKNYVKSLSEDGRSISFGNTSELVLNSLLSNDISNKLEQRKKEINHYKLLYKVKKVEDEQS